jgi:hypothetical protein
MVATAPTGQMAQTGLMGCQLQTFLCLGEQPRRPQHHLAAASISALKFLRPLLDGLLQSQLAPIPFILQTELRQ